MALVVKDRVKEVTTTTGTSNLTLGGAVYGFQGFSIIGNGNTTYYGIYDSATGDWEVGVGTYSSTGPTLTRDTVFESSNAGSKVVFGAGSKDVFCTYPAERSVYLDAAGSAVTVLDIGTLGVSTANISTANITAGTVSTTPTSSNDLVNKSYVDSIAAQGITYHAPVKYEVPNTTGNLNATYNNGTAGVGATLTNNGTKAAFAPDGPTAQVGDRVLVYNQTNAFENGVYEVTVVGTPDPGGTNWVLTRTADADSYGLKDPNAIGQGDAFYVTSGNTGAGETYVCNTAGTITFGTTAITFAQVSSAQVYSAGTGLTLSNLQFSITPVGTAGTYGSASSVPVFTTNASGQVTGVTNTGIAITSAAVSGLAASATTDTTNAANITSGTLNSARLSGSYTGITGVGTLTAGTWNATAIGAAYGGTGQTTYVQGDLLYATSSSTLGRLADVTSGNALISGGVGGDPAWGKIGLQTHVDGTLQVANGGTGATTLTGYVYGNGTGAFTASTTIPNSATTATSANTASAIVARDASGNFSAGTITASLNGNASTATTAANVNNGTLTMNVSGTGLSGSQTFTANQSSNVTFTVTSNATNANTASTIVARDASGNFSAGTITATLSGNSTTTSQRAFSGDISTGGQGRFTGWYTGNAATGVAVETGMSGGQGYIFVYNRDTSTYGTLNISSSAANMQFSGGTINVSSGALQQGGNQVLHAGNYNSYAPTLTGGGASGTWGINITGNAASATTAANYLPLAGGTMTGTIYTGSGVSSIIIGQQGGVTRGYLYNDSAGFGFLNSGGSWQAYVPYGTSYFQMNGSARSPIFYDSDNTAYYVDPAATSELNKVYYNSNMVSRNYGIGQVGLYSSYRYQAVFSMGESYLLPADGTTTGNLYGIAWSHPNAGGAASNLASHGMLLLENGGFYGAWGGGRIVTVSDIRGTLFYDYNNTAYYVDPASTTYLYNLTLAGGGYFQPNNWIQFNASYGLYWPSNNGAHFHANASSSYGQLMMQGSRGGYGGIYDSYSAVNGIMYASNGDGGVYREANGRWYWYYSVGSDCMGIGTSSTSSTYSLYLNKGVYAQSRIDATIFYDSNNTTYYLDPNSTTSLRTVGSWRSDSAAWDGEFSGKIQYHSSNWYFQYAGNAIFRNSGGTNVMVCDTSGNVTFNGNVTAYSDARLKENVVTIDSALDKALRLRGVYYNKIGGVERKAGVIAQEVLDVFPEVVRSVSETNPSTGETQELYAVDYGNLTGLLIEAIKELSAKVDALK